MAETSLRAVTKGEKCKMVGSGYCPISLEHAAAFLSKKWTLSIIVIIGNFGILRFNDILHRIDGITQKTLSERLQELEKHGLVTRNAFAEKPPRVEYSLTMKGQKLRKAVLPLLRFAESRFQQKLVRAPQEPYGL